MIEPREGRISLLAQTRPALADWLVLPENNLRGSPQITRDWSDAKRLDLSQKLYRLAGLNVGIVFGTPALVLDPAGIDRLDAQGKPRPPAPGSWDGIGDVTRHFEYSIRPCLTSLQDDDGRRPIFTLGFGFGLDTMTAGLEFCGRRVPIEAATPEAICAKAFWLACHFLLIGDRDEHGIPLL